MQAGAARQASQQALSEVGRWFGQDRWLGGANEAPVETFAVRWRVWADDDEARRRQTLDELPAATT